MQLPKSTIQVLVTGANGQLANEIKVLSLDFHAWHFLFVTREELPIENFDVVKSLFEKKSFNYCINCAAYTAVDKAESESDKAFLINADAVGNLAAVCKLYDTQFIHISTDYVYDGTISKPLTELSSVKPVNVYGASKLKGEELALSKNAKSIIIRTSWVYSSFGNNFVKTMLRLFKEKDEINVVEDQIGCPTYAADLASVILLFIQRLEEGEQYKGIFNYSNEGITNWYEFAMAIKEITNAKCLIHPIPTSAYKTPADRPLYSVLNIAKIKNTLFLSVPNWKESLSNCLRLIS
ncbi:MAG: dTDP-4-dehydrorhamnose reductase [Ginsengibacter sp.]|jgi:dTDP-4-dehydrorhamnose reductase